MKKMLYMMHIDWDWIFQRPQILAMELSKYFDVTVQYRFANNRKTVRKNKIRPQKQAVYFQLPKNNLPIIKQINTLIRSIYKRKIIKGDYDYLWVCSPELFDVIPEGYQGKIIYDCMDRHVHMAKSERKQQVEKMESALIAKASQIFVSSQSLYEDIKSVNPDKKVVVIRNGYVQSKLFYDERAAAGEKAIYKVAYIGTVDTWFDFDTITSNVAQFKNVTYDIIGPTVVKKAIERVHYRGIVPHDELYANIKDVDCLVMPFILNDTVLAVDPVKLYEYISYGKCIISIYYPEIERFGDFVHFYSTGEEYNALVYKLIETNFKPKYSQKQQSDFLVNNTWDKRVSDIVEILTEKNEDVQI